MKVVIVFDGALLAVDILTFGGDVLDSFGGIEKFLNEKTTEGLTPRFGFCVKYR